MDSLGLYRPLAIASVHIPGNLFLAPVAGYTDRAFRSVCVDHGANLCCTELVSAEALSRNSCKTEKLLQRAENERVLAIQLFGSDPDVLYRAALRLAPWKPDILDLNCGCPVPKVVKTGSGSALMKDPDLLARCVQAMCRASKDALGDIPVTVKIRSGWDASSINFLEVGRLAVNAGAALVALHARTRTQMYDGVADWTQIGELAAALDVPVAASGDIFCPEAARDVLRSTACAAVMFARGAMGNPFIFSETRSLLETGKRTELSAKERIQTGFNHLLRAIEDSPEHIACREMRKHFCAYTKGLPGAAALRNQLVHAETIVDYQRLLAQWLDY